MVQFDILLLFTSKDILRASFRKRETYLFCEGACISISTSHIHTINYSTDGTLLAYVCTGKTFPSLLSLILLTHTSSFCCKSPQLLGNFLCPVLFSKMWSLLINLLASFKVYCIYTFIENLISWCVDAAICRKYHCFMHYIWHWNTTQFIQM